jgi:hypothetical protein
MARSSVHVRLAALREWLSFSASVRTLVDTLNWEIASPEKVRSRLPSHPSGFTREIAKRRLTIAEAWLRLVTTTEIDAWRERLEILKVLVHQAWHSKTLSMPINAARVQIALMKSCVESRGDKRRQLERMSDFAQASFGREAVIRRLLRELDMLELPEDGRPLRDMGLGWDDHVHDLLTEGRKTPCQLLLDAFIGGISHLTVVYSDLSDTRLAEEAIEAGRILGIEVDVGVEFSVGPRGGRVHFMYLPPGFDSLAGLREFVRDQEATLRPLHEGLAHNAASRRQTVSELLDRFNETHLGEINDRFRNLPFLQLPPLRWEALSHLLYGGHASRLHVGKLIEETLKPVMHQRVLYLKAQYRHAEKSVERGNASTWELENLRSQYEEARRDYEGCLGERLAERYMLSTDHADYASAFESPGDILPLLASTGGSVVFIHPLSRGADSCVGTLLENHRWIDAIEAFNLADATSRDPADLRRLNALVSHLNANRPDELRALLSDWGLDAGRDPGHEEAIREACRHYGERPLRTRCASDYVGRDARATGMGFLASTALPPRTFAALRKEGHPVLPAQVGHLILSKGDPNVRIPDSARVLVLGSIAPRASNRVGDEDEIERVGLSRFWRHLHLDLKILLKLSLAFVPACLVVGPGYTLLWFGITAFRNTIVDMIAAAGLALRLWRLDQVDRDNLANSLFFTGFSVPVMAAARWAFDLQWGHFLPNEGVAYTLVKFLVIAAANGAWIATHNRLRGFDRNVIRGNFFRTVLSWPLATGASLLLGPLNEVIPAIVQSKIWSDLVGAVIEGTGKLAHRRKLCQRDYLELLHDISHGDRPTRLTAMADLLAVWARRHQGRSSLRRLFQGKLRLDPRAAVTPMVPMDPEALRSAWTDLVRCFSSEGAIEDLTGLLLQHYQGREAIVLTALVAEHYDEFLDWLKANGRVGAPAP